MTSLEIARGVAGLIPVLTLRGRLTLGEGSRALRRSLEEIAAEGHKHILLDLSEVSYVDSSGLGALVAGYNSLKARQGTVGLFGVPARVQELLDLSRLTTIFRVFSSQAEAEKYFADGV
jgi:anti-sigma B factor antagonist